MKERLLLVRLDKIGDLILTLPADQIPECEKYDTRWVIGRGLGFIAESARPLRSFDEVDLSSRRLGSNQFAKILADFKPHLVVIFFAPWWISWQCFRHQVPVRAGRLSQWHSFIFLNRGLRQSRSQSAQHETEYNVGLLQHALGAAPNPAVNSLVLKSGKSESLLPKLNLLQKEYVVVHPGMAGSALNWSQKQYSQLISLLIENYQVVVTGTKADDPWLSELKPAWSNHPRVKWLQGQLNQSELVTLLGYAHAVVAPSTGVAHLAASVGTKTIAIYSPLPAHSKRRWGVRGSRATSVAPEVTCPATQACLGVKCAHYSCIELVEPRLIANHVKEASGSSEQTAEKS